MAAEKIVLRQDTLTLKHPTLQDLWNVIQKTKGPTIINLNGFKLSGTVSHLSLAPVAGSRSYLDKILRINGGDLTIMHGTIDLGTEYSISIEGGSNIVFNNVTITGDGQRWHRRLDAHLLHISKRATCLLEDAIVECNSHSPLQTVLVTSGGILTVSGSRLYGTPGGNALKVQGAAVMVRRRSIIQGGLLVTSPQGHPEHRQPLAASELTHEELQAAEIYDGISTGAGSQGRSNAHGSMDNEPEFVSSSVELKQSEILPGNSTCIMAVGAGSKLTAEKCTIGGSSTNFCVSVCKGAHIDLQDCDVHGASQAAVVVSGGATLSASRCAINANTVGLQVERGGAAEVRKSIVSGSAEGTCAHVAGSQSVIRAVDSTFRPDRVSQVSGGAYVREDGVAAAFEQLQRVPVH